MPLEVAVDYEGLGGCRMREREEECLVTVMVVNKAGCYPDVVVCSSIRITVTIHGDRSDKLTTDNRVYSRKPVTTSSTT